MQVKTKGARKISFSQFMDALSLVASKTGVSLSAAAQTVVAANGPSVSGTRAHYVKFHDDKASSAKLLHFPACVTVQVCMLCFPRKAA